MERATYHYRLGCSAYYYHIGRGGFSSAHGGFSSAPWYLLPTVVPRIGRGVPYLVLFRVSHARLVKRAETALAFLLPSGSEKDKFVRRRTLPAVFPSGGRDISLKLTREAAKEPLNATATPENMEVRLGVPGRSLRSGQNAMPLPTSLPG